MIVDEKEFNQGGRAEEIREFQSKWKKENVSEIHVTIDGAIANQLIQATITGIPFLEKKELMQLQQAQDPLLIAVAPARIIFNGSTNEDLNTASDEYIGREIIEESIVRFVTPKVLKNLARRMLFFKGVETEGFDNLPLLNSCMESLGHKLDPEVVRSLVRYTLLQSKEDEKLICERYEVSNITEFFANVGRYFNQIDRKAKERNLAGKDTSITEKIKNYFFAMGASRNGIVLLNSEHLNNFIGVLGIYYISKSVSMMSPDKPLWMNLLNTVPIIGGSVPIVMNVGMVPLILVHEMIHHIIASSKNNIRRNNV